MAWSTQQVFAIVIVLGVTFLASISIVSRSRNRRTVDYDSNLIIGSKRTVEHNLDVAVDATCVTQPLLSEVMKGYTGPDVSPSDAGLVNRIRKYFIDLPRPYVTKFSMPIVETPQAKEVNKIFDHKKNGFFVECGALDGERSSNTIWLEQKQGWNGLLVEMDPSYYLQVRGKNRKCFSVNACLSPEGFPTKMQFKEHKMGEGRLVTGEETAQKDQYLIHDTFCFPLESLMLALNRTRIDYFSLDVEGMEMPILKSIPFERLEIAVLTVEYKHGKEKKEYQTFMKSKGYKMVKELNFVIKELYLGGSDFVFVREDLL